MGHTVDMIVLNSGRASTPKNGRNLCTLSFCKPNRSASEIDDVRKEVKNDDLSELATTIRSLIRKGFIKEDQVLVLADGREITYGQLLEIAEKRKKLPQKNAESVCGALQGAASIQLMEAKEQIITLLLNELSRFNSERGEFPIAQQKLFLKNFISFLKNDDLITEDQQKLLLALVNSGKIEEATSGIQLSLTGKKEALETKIQNEKVKLSRIRHVPPALSSRSFGRSTPGLPFDSKSAVEKKAESIPCNSQAKPADRTSPITEEPNNNFANYFKELMNGLERLDEAKKSVAHKIEEEEKIDKEHKKDELNKVRRVCQEIGVPESYMLTDYAELENYSMDALRALALSVKRQFADFKDHS